jgi:hypothetical protein
MRHLVLHNPSSQAHLEDLQDRLAQSLSGRPSWSNDGTKAEALITTVAQVVRAMDLGLLTVEEVRAVLSSFQIPEFSIERWLEEMVDEGVYLDSKLAQAA